MSFQPADSMSLALFSGFCALMLGLIVYAFHKAQVAHKFLYVFLAYVVLLSAAAASGLVRDHVLPAAPLLFASLFLLALIYAFSSAGARIAGHFSVAALVGFQGFRLPLELILHRWVEVGTIPATMSWNGQNLDILSGIAALALMPIAGRSRVIAWVFQVLGFALLMNVLRVVILSSPFPFSWNLENPLQLAMYFPYVLIAPLFVAPALFGHLVLARKLLGATN